jgi:hypothetical protein
MWRWLRGLVGPSVAACSGATTAGKGDGDVSVGALRAQARKDLAGLEPLLVPASGGGWAFAAIRPRRTRPGWLHASLLGTDAADRGRSHAAAVRG